MVFHLSFLGSVLAQYAYQSVQGDHEKVSQMDIIKNTINVYKCDFK
jgi:hypothetical protein